MSDQSSPKYHEAVQELMYGHRQVPQDDDFRISWKAVKAVAAGDGVFSEPERMSLLGRMAALLTPSAIMEEVLGWDPAGTKVADLLAQVQVPDHIRRGTGAWMIYNGLSVAAADEELASGELEATRQVAESMDVDADTVDALHQIVLPEADVRKRRISTLMGTIPETFHFSHE